MAVHAKKARSEHCLVTSTMALSLVLAKTRFRMRQSLERLSMQKVVLFQIGACSADVHENLSDVSLKLKVVVNGSTHLKSKAGKASIGMGEHLRINFENMGGCVIYEGGETLQFELCRAGVLRSSQILASCAVPLMTALQNILNEPGKELSLELLSLDTPGKVLANISFQIGLRMATLEDVGGFRVLKTPSLRIPAVPNAESEFTTDSEAVASFCNKVDEVADRLKAVHVASMRAIASCTQSAFRSLQLEVADDTSMMASASRPREAAPASKLEMAEADGVSTSSGDGSDEKHLSGGGSNVEEASIQSSQSIRKPLQSNHPQLNQLGELAEGLPTSLECLAALHLSDAWSRPDPPQSNQFDEIVNDVIDSPKSLKSSVSKFAHPNDAAAGIVSI